MDPLAGFGQPSPEEHAALLAQLKPLPLRGRAWPRWIGVFAWLFLALIAVRLGMVLQLPPEDSLSLPALALVGLSVAALIWMAVHMWTSVTEISDWGLRQSWISRREISWSELQSTRFIPLFASKKLVCFAARGRPITFQAGTPELQAAFARISLVYRRQR